MDDKAKENVGIANADCEYINPQVEMWDKMVCNLLPQSKKLREWNEANFDKDIEQARKNLETITLVYKFVLETRIKLDV